MAYKTIYTEVEVDVDMSDFDTDDLIEELESRGARTGEFGDGTEFLRTIYEKRRLGQDYQTELEQLIWLGLGKIV
jgi:nitrogen regulatory protein PII